MDRRVRPRGGGRPPPSEPGAAAPRGGPAARDPAGDGPATPRPGAGPPRPRARGLSDPARPLHRPPGPAPRFAGRTARGARQTTGLRAGAVVEGRWRRPSGHRPRRRAGEPLRPPRLHGTAPGRARRRPREGPPGLPEDCIRAAILITAALAARPAAPRRWSSTGDACPPGPGRPPPRPGRHEGDLCRQPGSRAPVAGQAGAPAGCDRGPPRARVSSRRRADPRSL